MCVCARWLGERCGTGRSGWKREGNAASPTELAKEVELTSVGIFSVRVLSSDYASVKGERRAEAAPPCAQSAVLLLVRPARDAGL